MFHRLFYVALGGVTVLVVKGLAGGRKPVVKTVYKGIARVNRGFENLALSGDGQTAYAILQSPMGDPDEKKFAFTQISRDRIDLYLVDLESKTAKKINIAALNAVAGGAFWWAGNDRLVYKTVPANYRKYPDAPAAPRGPIVQENMGKAAAARTYQDLIKSPYDEDLFDYMATAQLVLNEGGMEKPIGKTAIYTGVRVSPDKNFLLVETVNRPFSYLVPVFDFPETVSVIDMNGKLVRTIATNPSSEGQPIGFDDAVTYPRNFNWRDDEPGTVVYVQALDKGLGRSKSDFRDAVYAVKMNDSSNRQMTKRVQIG